MFPTSQIEISRSALQHNIAFIRGIVGPEVRITSVLKGNAYGHGIEQFAPLVEDAGVDHIAVFHADEALRVKSVCQAADIMIMGMIDNEELFWAIENDIEFYVFEHDRLEKAIEVAKRMGKAARVHLELETGMNRMGFTRQELKKCLGLLQEEKDHYVLEGVCTHFAGAEHVANYVRIRDQFNAYKRMLKWLKERGIEPKYRHAASSAASISYPRTRLDMVRIGILQYGFWPSTETFIGYLGNRKDREDPLQRVVTWRSKVMNTKTVKAGEFIGYGMSYLTEGEMCIASVPVGYADGYSRHLSNQGRVLINGGRRSVVGTVNMNMLLADVTDAPDTQKGDEAILIGRQGDSVLSVSAFGEFSAQLNYEILTKLSRSIPRIVVN